MALVSNQWLKPLTVTTRDPWHSPNAVEIERDHTPYKWARANEMAAVFKLSLKGGDYQVLGVRSDEATTLVQGLAPSLDEAARTRLVLELLNGLPDRDFLAVISKAMGKRARRAAR